MLKIITPPTVEPVTVDEVKLQAVIGNDLDDALLALMISAARGDAEAITHRSIAEQTLEVVLDGFPSWQIDLPKGPVSQVLSVKYIDINGDEQTLVAGVDYDVDTEKVIAKVMPVDGGEWPETKNVPNAVRVRYEAGYTETPAPIKMWLVVRVASLYAQRESHVPGTNFVAHMGRNFVDSLLDDFVIPVAP